MKYRDLVARLRAEGCVLSRRGARHDLYRNVITGVQEAVPRHSEVKETTARAIIRALSAPDGGGGAEK